MLQGHVFPQWSTLGVCVYLQKERLNDDQLNKSLKELACHKLSQLENEVLDKSQVNSKSCPYNL